jgi:hypothetical protein
MFRTGSMSGPMKKVAMRRRERGGGGANHAKSFFLVFLRALRVSLRETFRQAAHFLYSILAGLLQVVSFPYSCSYFQWGTLVAKGIGLPAAGRETQEFQRRVACSKVCPLGHKNTWINLPNQGIDRMLKVYQKQNDW